jgi:hypothetical protein
MNCEARSRIAFVAVAALVAPLLILIAGCAVEVPKSALPGFRLTPPTESPSATKSEISKPTEARSS